MLLQVVTIFKANERHVKFDLPENLNIFDYAAKPLQDKKVSEFKVSLKNLSLCNKSTHAHVHQHQEHLYHEEEDETVADDDTEFDNTQLDDLEKSV